MTDYFFYDKETILKKNEKKKKLHDLLDKYGSVENIEKNAIGVDGYDYMFANTNNLIKEVLEERLLGQASRLAKQEKYSNEYEEIRKEEELENISNYIPSEGFDDIYYSKLDKDGRVVYLGTAQHEGGYSDRKNDLGKKTNYGITQFSLDEYNNLWNSYLKKGKNFPKDVRQLKPIQAKQILDEMYFQRYGINKIKNTRITRNVFDEEMNQGTNAGKDIAEFVNKVKGTNFPLNKVVSDKLAAAINNLSLEESIEVNDLLTLRRMERYFESVDKKPNLNINNLRGWYNRAQSYHSQPKIFEKLYKDKVDYYIQKKYPHYYNGM